MHSVRAYKMTFAVQRTRTKFAERAFSVSVAGVSVLNSLYLQISDSSLTLLVLKANLKVTCFALFLLSNFLIYKAILSYATALYFIL